MVSLHSKDLGGNLRSDCYIVTQKQKTDVSEYPQVAAETIPIQVEMTSYWILFKSK